MVRGLLAALTAGFLSFFLRVNMNRETLPVWISGIVIPVTELKGVLD